MVLIKRTFSLNRGPANILRGPHIAQANNAAVGEILEIERLKDLASPGSQRDPLGDSRGAREHPLGDGLAVG